MVVLAEDSSRFTREKQKSSGSVVVCFRRMKRMLTGLKVLSRVGFWPFVVELPEPCARLLRRNVRLYRRR